MSQEISLEELKERVASAVVEMPSWESARRVNVLALSEDDAKISVRQTFGEEAAVEALVFRSALLEALDKTQGQAGYWVADATGQELFAPADIAEMALASYTRLTDREPASWISSQEISDNIAEMDRALAGEDAYMIISDALVKQVASRFAR